MATVDTLSSFAPDNFAKPIPARILNIEDKTRSNNFSWRGQFSPQLVKALLTAYCPPGAILLDPFAGSGTVLHEAALMGIEAYGFDLNPAAWILGRLYEFVNVPAPERESAIRELALLVDDHFPVRLLGQESLSLAELEQRVTEVAHAIGEHARMLLDATIVLADVSNNHVTTDLIQSKLHEAARLCRDLPYSDHPIRSGMHDARSLPLSDDSIGCVITSPPYINVFNYHQNYRRSTELLGWDILRVSRSEIGSNRANRGNRFRTVVQYCLDMAQVLHEMRRVLSRDGRAVLVLGHSSKVLSVPFYNADIISEIASRSGLFGLELRQSRVFTNRFGLAIREDILNLGRSNQEPDLEASLACARAVAREALENGLAVVAPQRRALLQQAMEQTVDLAGTPVFRRQDRALDHAPVRS